MSVIEVENLTFSYGEGKAVLKDISFSVYAGEVFVIAGLSGSGKTTLCRILSGVIPHAIKGDVGGKIAVMDTDPRDAELFQMALKAGMVFQDADSQVICTTVEDELAFGLENLCIPAEEIRNRVNGLLKEFGCEKLQNANPSRLSGGQKKLLTIAAVLATAPPILIMDEPMSGLDEDGRELVRTAILEQRRQGRTVIIVEHNLELVGFADKWLLLHDGKTAAHGAPSEIMRDKNMLRDLGLL